MPQLQILAGFRFVENSLYSNVRTIKKRTDKQYKRKRILAREYLRTPKMNELDAIAKIAKSKATANRIAKSLSHSQLKSAIGNLQSALKTAEAREAEKNNKRRAANIKKLASMMAEMGLSPNDIAKATSSRAQTVGAKKSKVRAKTTTRKSKVGPKKGSKVAPKYKITSEGKTHKWTGRGRMPLVFKHFIEQGGALDKCLI